MRGKRPTSSLASSTRRPRRRAFLAIGYPEALGGNGGDLTHVLVAAEEMVLAGKSVGTLVGLGSLGIALPPIREVRKRRAEGALRATCAQRREDQRPRDYRAWGRKRCGGRSNESSARWRSLHRQRFQDVHHIRLSRRLRDRCRSNWRRRARGYFDARHRAATRQGSRCRAS